MKMHELVEAERLRKHLQHLVRQIGEIQTEGQSYPSALTEAIAEQRELRPILQAIVLHQLSWSIAEAKSALARLGVEVDALG